MNLLREANHIVAIGFDFHEQNVRLLDLANSKISPKIRTLNFAGARGFDLRAHRTGLAESDVWKRAGVYQITDAIDDGLFEA
jgi:hypothetical protein